MVPVIDHRHDDAKASGTVMVVMIGRALLVMRIAWARVVVIVVMIVTVLVDGGHDIAGIGHEGAAVHADEHADNHDGLEKESHIDAPKIGGRARGSRHFGNMMARPLIGSGRGRPGHVARASPPASPPAAFIIQVSGSARHQGNPQG